MKQFIPNFITLLNVLCGGIAAVFAVRNDLELAALFVFLGIVFDFFDGLVARALNAQSEIGVQLDSLADVITSGLVPGIVMFQLLSLSQTGGWINAEANGFYQDQLWGQLMESPLPLLGFLITMASAYRLAKFNIDEDQVHSFTGLPTPANALLILSLPLILLYQGNDTLNSIILNPWFLVVLTLLSAYLLNSRIQLFALKFKDWSFKTNAVKYIFLILVLVMILTLKFLAVPLIIAMYILSSFLVKNKEITT